MKAAGTNQTRAHRLLVVDDEALVAFDLQSMLTDAGYAVQVAHDSKHALRVAQEHVPDGIILDVNLGSGPDGIATASILRSIGIDAPIIFLTAYGDEMTRARITLIGRAWLLHKPAMPQEVDAAIRSALRFARYRKT